MVNIESRYVALGFTDKEARAIVELETKETMELRSFQYWVSRYDLITSGISNVEKVRKEMKDLV